MSRTNDEKKQLLIKMCRSVVTKIDYGSKVSEFPFVWAKEGIQTIRQIKFRQVGNKFTNIIVELDDPKLVKDMFLSMDTGCSI